LKTSTLATDYEISFDATKTKPNLTGSVWVCEMSNSWSVPYVPVPEPKINPRVLSLKGEPTISLKSRSKRLEPSKTLRLSPDEPIVDEYNMNDHIKWVDETVSAMEYVDSETDSEAEELALIEYASDCAMIKPMLKLFYVNSAVQDGDIVKVKLCRRDGENLINCGQNAPNDLRARTLTVKVPLTRLFEVMENETVHLQT